MSAYAVQRGLWITRRVTRRPPASVASAGIAAAALFALAVLHLWIAVGFELRLVIAGEVVDRYVDLPGPLVEQLIRPYRVGVAIGGTASVLAGLALLVAAWLVLRYGHRARVAGLAMVGLVTAFQLMSAVVGLSRRSNATVVEDSTVAAAPGDRPYDVISDAVAWLGMADAAVVVVGLTLAGLAVLALRPVGGARPMRPHLSINVTTGALFALAAVFALVAAGTVRRLSTAYEVGRAWELPPEWQAQLVAPFVRSAFVVGAPSLAAALAFVVVAVEVRRRATGATVLALVLCGIAGAALGVAFLVGLTYDREPGQVVARGGLIVIDGALRFVWSSFVSPVDELRSRLLSLSTLDTAGQVIGVLLVALAVSALGHRKGP